MAAILLVEDEPVVTAVAVDLLEMEGHSVSPFSLAGKAIIELRSRPSAYSVVILDALIADMDWAQFVLEGRASGFAGPVVLWTGAADFSRSLLDDPRFGIISLVLKGRPADLLDSLREAGIKPG